jgi:aminoglycoside/choline kinase family phosphotransferase
MGAPATEQATLEPLIDGAVRACLGVGARRFEWLEGQLGLRRFARVHLEGREPASLIARIDAAEDPAGRPAGAAPEPPLEPIRARLEAAGLPVPARYGGDPATGIDLLEDLGDASLRDVAAESSPGALRALYEEACDLVPGLQRVTDGGLEAFQRRLDAESFAYKAELFARHGLTARGRAATPAEVAAVGAAFARVARAAGEAPERLAHRDLQSANLHVRPGRPAGRRLTMIDLQGALLAPPEYDLVCLLRDSYVELDEAELAHQLSRVRPKLPDAPCSEDFEARFDLLTLTRKGKDCARFLFAARERGDRRFLPYLPATLRALRRAAARAAARDPGYADLAGLIAELPEQPCAG